MSYENGTLHYNLPQTIGSDKRDWFDTNEPFAAIDSAIHTAVEQSEEALTKVNTFETRISTLESDVTDIKSDIGDVKDRLDTDEQAIIDLQTKEEDDYQNIKDMIEVSEESSATASSNHARGSYFIYNDTLYVATLDITAGQDIVPSTNCMTADICTKLYYDNFIWSGKQEQEAGTTAKFTHMPGEHFWLAGRPAVTAPKYVANCEPTTNFTMNTINVGDVLTADKNFILLNASLLGYRIGFQNIGFRYPEFRGTTKDMNYGMMMRMLGYVLCEWAAAVYAETTAFRFDLFKECKFYFDDLVFTVTGIQHDTSNSKWYINLSSLAGNINYYGTVTYDEDDGNIQTAVTATVTQYNLGNNTSTDISTQTVADGTGWEIYLNTEFPVSQLTV